MSDDWQPIETAPKDGFMVLVCVAGSKIPAIAFCFSKTWIPTHWVPMPEPPEHEQPEAPPSG